MSHTNNTDFVPSSLSPSNDSNELLPFPSLPALTLTIPATAAAAAAAAVADSSPDTSPRDCPRHRRVWLPHGPDSDSDTEELYPSIPPLEHATLDTQPLPDNSPVRSRSSSSVPIVLSLHNLPADSYEEDHIQPGPPPSASEAPARSAAVASESPQEAPSTRQLVLSSSDASRHLTSPQPQPEPSTTTDCSLRVLLYSQSALLTLVRLVYNQGRDILARVDPPPASAHPRSAAAVAINDQDNQDEKEQAAPESPLPATPPPPQLQPARPSLTRSTHQHLTSCIEADSSDGDDISANNINLGRSCPHIFATMVKKYSFKSVGNADTESHYRVGTRWMQETNGLRAAVIEAALELYKNLDVPNGRTREEVFKACRSKWFMITETIMRVYNILITHDDIKKHAVI